MGVGMSKKLKGLHRCYLIWLVLSAYIVLSSNALASVSEWQIAEGELSRQGSDDDLTKIVVITTQENTEVRIYPRVPFTRNGETRVRYEFGEEPGNDDFTIWRTVLTQGRYGYVTLPEDEVDYFLGNADSQGSFSIELIDRNDRRIIRTFAFDGYEDSFDQMRREYPELAIPSRYGNRYFVHLTAAPANASVLIEEYFLFSWIPSSEGNGPFLDMELTPGRYRAVVTSPDYLREEREFRVPDTTSLAIGLEKPSGSLGGLVENGFISSEFYGNDWPLTVDEGTLACRPPRMATIVTTEGVYALNRAAEDIFPSVEAIVEGDLDISTLTERALQLCESE